MMSRKIGLGIVVLAVATLVLCEQESFARGHRKGCGSCGSACSTCTTGGTAATPAPADAPAQAAAPADSTPPAPVASTAPAEPKAVQSVAGRNGRVSRRAWRRA